MSARVIRSTLSTVPFARRPYGCAGPYSSSNTALDGAHGRVVLVLPQRRQGFGALLLDLRLGKCGTPRHVDDDRRASSSKSSAGRCTRASAPAGSSRPAARRRVRRARRPARRPTVARFRGRGRARSETPAPAGPADRTGCRRGSVALIVTAGVIAVSCTITTRRWRAPSGPATARGSSVTVIGATLRMEPADRQRRSPRVVAARPRNLLGGDRVDARLQRGEVTRARDGSK